MSDAGMDERDFEILELLLKEERPRMGAMGVVWCTTLLAEVRRLRAENENLKKVLSYYQGRTMAQHRKAGNSTTGE